MRRQRGGDKEKRGDGKGEKCLVEDWTGSTEKKSGSMQKIWNISDL